MVSKNSFFLEWVEPWFCATLPRLCMIVDLPGSKNPLKIARKPYLKKTCKPKRRQIDSDQKHHENGGYFCWGQHPSKINIFLTWMLHRSFWSQGLFRIPFGCPNGTNMDRKWTQTGPELTTNGSKNQNMGKNGILTTRNHNS